MKNKNHDKKKLPKKLLACAISITVLTQVPSAYADELNQENEEIVEKTQDDQAISENQGDEKIKEDIEVKDQDREDVETDLEISPEEKPQANKAENVENPEDNKNDTKDEEVIEWEKTSAEGEEVTEVIKDGTRYNKLESNKNNDNEKNIFNQENILEDNYKNLEQGPQIDDSKAQYDTIKSDDLTATIDKVFPRIKEYSYKGQKFLANQNFTDTLKVNGLEVKPQVSYEKLSENEAKYRLDIKDEENYIDAILDLRMKILENQVHFDIVDIKNNNNIKGGDVIDNPKLLLSTIDFRDNFLASVSSSEEIGRAHV